MALFHGKVITKRVSEGSKSERTSVVLHTVDGEDLILRRTGGHPFRDPALDALVGRTIVGTGRRSGSMIVLTKWSTTDQGEQE